jgi:hypothetical protein
VSFYSFFSKKFCNSKKETTFALPTEGNMVIHVTVKMVR